jgi:hypothetical protein
MRELIEKKIEEAKSPRWTPTFGWEDWKLYEPEGKKGQERADKAVAALNAGMMQFKKLAAKVPKTISEWNIEKVGKAMGAIFDKQVAPVHRKFLAAGSDDTPCWEVSITSAIQMVKDIYGKKGWTKLADYIG